MGKCVANYHDVRWYDFQTVTDLHPVMPALEYTKHHLMVTQYKDSERYISGTYDLNRLGDIQPRSSMKDYLDGEDIVQKVNKVQ